MDFEPRESRLATIGKRILVVGMILLGACLVYLRSHFPLGRLGARIPLPGRIGTVTEGYPFALKLRDGDGSDASLVFAQVTLRRERDHYMTDQITYFFVSSAGKGRMSMVMIM